MLTTLKDGHLRGLPWGSAEQEHTTITHIFTLKEQAGLTFRAQGNIDSNNRFPCFNFKSIYSFLSKSKLIIIIPVIIIIIIIIIIITDKSYEPSGP